MQTLGNFLFMQVLETAAAYGQISEESLVLELLGYLENQIINFNQNLID